LWPFSCFDIQKTVTPGMLSLQMDGPFVLWVDAGFLLQLQQFTILEFLLSTLGLEVISILTMAAHMARQNCHFLHLILDSILSLVRPCCCSCTQNSKPSMASYWYELIIVQSNITLGNGQAVHCKRQDSVGLQRVSSWSQVVNQRH
jgi:hypothetical protein